MPTPRPLARPVHRPRRALPALLLAVALVAAACGGGDGDNDGSPGTTVLPGPLTTGTTPTAVEAEPSPGCEADPPEPGRSEVTVLAGDTERSYVLYVPEGLEAGQPAPLVIDWGAFSPASDEERISGFTQAGADGTVPAEERGAIVVTPEPTGGDDPKRTWNLTGQDDWPDDDTFIRNLLLNVRATTCVDRGRTIVMGFGVGGSMAAQMACAHANDVGVLVGVAGIDFPPECDPVHPVPVLTIHGLADPVLPLEGATGPNLEQLGLGPATTAGLEDLFARRKSVRATMLEWSVRNDCDEQPETDEVATGVNRSTWTGCNEGASVSLVSVEGGGHTWPGSTGMDDLIDVLGPVSDAVDANDLIWEFFAAQVPG